MTLISRMIGVSAAFLAAAFAQPVINSGGVMNAASYALPGLPNSGIAQGSMFIVFGSKLGPSALAQASSFPLLANLAGTSIRVTVNGTGVDALMVYTVAGQAVAILPSNTPLGNGTLTVGYNGQTSAAVPVRVVRSSFGAFTVNQAESGPAIVQNVLSGTERPVNSLTKAARPGHTMILWGTGLGPVSGNEAGGALPGPIDGNAEIYVGGKRANVIYKGRSGCCAGLDQIVFEVPADVEGCYVPVAVKTGDVVSNFTTISVARTGEVCSDTNGLSAEDLNLAQQTGNFRIGHISLNRSTSKMSIPEVGPIDSKTDSGSAGFVKYDIDKLVKAQGVFGSAVSMGACTVYTYRGEQIDNIDPIKPEDLDAGPVLTLVGPKGTKQLVKEKTGYYAKLGGGISGLPSVPGAPAMPVEPDFLEPGDYTVDNGSGGSGPNAVGAFRTTLTIPALLKWENQDGITSVSRSQGQTVTWSGGDPNGTVTIFGASSSGNTGAGFVCIERTSARQFTVPPVVLLTLPANSSERDFGLLSVMGSAGHKKFTAMGLDAGYFDASAGSSKTVSYR